MSDERRRSRSPRRSRFRAGQLVRIKTAAEIAATLDDDGTLDGLPFMPEMVRFCGGVVEVRGSAHKTCAYQAGMRSLDAAVFLDGLHCDGSAHGGCQTRCPIFWKDTWLEPAADGETGSPPGDPGELGCKASRSVLVRGRDPAAGTYSCQSTELIEATAPLSAWSPRQYWDDVRSGNAPFGAVLRALPLLFFNRFQRLSTRVLPPRLRIRGGRTFPHVAGTLTKTPDVRLGVGPGEGVETRSHAEILETLDAEGRNRGLGFDRDMIPYCGQRFTVRGRVEVRVDDLSGELRHLSNPCVVLDGVVCKGRYHLFCARELDCYWREAWLRRLETGERGG
ncbi:MAG: hypothetical protein ACXVRJ_10780 [Gaiellaceae bacterium]